MIHIVPPTRGYRAPFSGRAEIQTLIVHPLISAVDFLVDGNLASRATKMPYVGHVELAHPPRKQILQVRGYNALGQVLGADRMILNQPDVPFGVRIRTMRRLRETEGRETEDAQILEGADYQSEIDVQLAQFQLLVTDNDGSPVSELSPEDFEIRENGRRRPPIALHTAYDVPLVLGLAIDTSNSVVPIWHQVKDVSAGFLEAALSPGDRAFVVDFAGTVRLASELTGYKPLIESRVRSLAPRLGTALNDGILFSLLQYDSEPGRRALVVVTDGFDEHSRSEWSQSTVFAERLGVPIYFIQLDRSTRMTRVMDSLGRTHFRSNMTVPQRQARKRLKQISQRTGGRAFTIELRTGGPPITERFQRVFHQIEEDLRHQHVLTYYIDQPQDAAIKRQVRVTRRGLKLASAVPLEAIE